MEALAAYFEKKDVIRMVDYEQDQFSMKIEDDE